MARITYTPSIPPHPGPSQYSSDGRGEAVTMIGTPNVNSPRYIYYRLYTKDGPLTSNSPIYKDDLSIGRTLPKLIRPPHTASSVKKHLCKIEGLSGSEVATLFESLSSQTPVEESSRLSLRDHSGPGLSEDDPIVLVVGTEDAECRSASTAELRGLPEAGPARPRYIYYRIYDEESAVASKTSFDLDDSFLGRIDVFSVTPPQTVTSLRCRVMKAEGFVSQTIQLFGDIDGEVPMNDNDHISLVQPYPGHVAEEPITIICTEKTRKKPKKSQNTAQVNRWTQRLSKPIRALNPWYLSDDQGFTGWLLFKKDEIMYTNGITMIGNHGATEYIGYTATNSAGKEGFVWKDFVVFC